MGEDHIHHYNGTLTGEHRHRAIIGFDKNGVAKVLIPADTHTHVDENGNVISRPVLGILGNSRYKDNAVSFIESLNLD